MLQMTGDRLSGLDSSFLPMERAGAHMDVASAIIFEGSAPSHEEFRDHIESRLHLVPRFRQKLRFVPFAQGRPVWVDDPHLNLDYHVRQTALPAPGSEEQLRNLAARIFSQQLDRSKPLWELWLVEGLDGDRFAIVGKSHHALVDGISGVDITTVLFDLEREPESGPVRPPKWAPRPEPTDLQLLTEALRERATSPREIARGVRATLRGPRQVLEGIGATSKMIGAGIAAPATPFNVEIGPHRRIAFVRADLADLKRVKNDHGGTVNDVVLSVVAGALGNYLRARGHDTSDLEMRAMVPVSVRAEEERGALGNRIAAMMAPLPVWCEDPVERLHLITETMGDLKGSGQAVGAEIITRITDFAPPTIASQAARLQPAQRFFNLVVTNVPGPQFPLYVLGRKMEAIFPLVPLARRQALCVGIMSYDGQINFGLVGDYDAMADLESFALDLEQALAEAIDPDGTRGDGAGGVAQRTNRALTVNGAASRK
ncbi:MAG TPA: wax ester/triacylglycerol synthase family O-acyltransferase [Solirubrobacterales bacterium]